MITDFYKGVLPKLVYVKSVLRLNFYAVLRLNFPLTCSRGFSAYALLRKRDFPDSEYFLVLCQSVEILLSVPARDLDIETGTEKS